jgi:hypothetical protein
MCIHQLQELEPHSTDIYNDDFIQLYPYRSKDSKFATMCLSEFVTTYKLTQYIPKTEKCLPRYLIDVKGTRKVIGSNSCN